MEVANLTSQFQVVSYSGASQSGTEDRFSIQKALDGNDMTKHCSGRGFNHDLLLEFTGERFTMTHFVAMGANGCTAPLKHGMAFVLDDQDFSTYGAAFNDCESEEDFQKIKSENPACAELPGLFFETNKMTFYSATRFHAQGKYVYVKFIRPHDDQNIDVGAVCIVGFPEATEETGPETIPSTMPECIRVCPSGSFRLDGDPEIVMPLLRPSFGKIPYVFAVTFDDAEKDALAATFDEVFAAEELNGVAIGCIMGRSEGGLGARLRDMMKIDPLCESLSGTFMFGFDDGKKYLVEDPDFERDHITAFAKDVASGVAPKFSSSAPRPEGDADPNHPGVTILVASSFEELVLADGTPDAFVDVYADWCPPCRMLAPHVVIAAEALAEEEIRVCKFDSDANDQPRDFFPERHIPILKFFKQDDKQHPVPFEGDRTAEGIVRFMHEHAVVKFDLDAALGRVASLTEAKEKMDEALGKMEEFLKDLPLCKGEFEGKEALVELDLNITALKERKGSMSIEELLARHEELVAERGACHEEAERIRNGNIVKCHSVVELDEQIDGVDEGKLVLLDIFASWCPPCRRIAPILTAMSLEIEDVLFLKIDHDESAEELGASERYKVSAFPTFFFFKGGKKVDELVGANEASLREKIDQNK